MNSLSSVGASYPFPVVSPPPPPVEYRPALHFGPLIDQSKKLASEHPSLFLGVITNIAGFLACLCSGEKMMKFLPATFIPTGLSVLYELLFNKTISPDDSKSSEKPEIIEVVDRFERAA